MLYSVPRKSKESIHQRLVIAFTLECLPQPRLNFGEPDGYMKLSATSNEYVNPAGILKYFALKRQNIPKIIHQIWLSGNPPDQWMDTFRVSFREAHPDWRYGLCSMLCLSARESPAVIATSRSRSPEQFYLTICNTLADQVRVMDAGANRGSAFIQQKGL